jgi:hypothetical protein
MKFLKNIFILVLITLMVNAGFSQKAPGYMGIKTMMSYSAIFSPNLFNINKNGEKGIKKLNYKHKFSLEYSINRKSSIGVAYEMYQTGIKYNFSINESEANGENYSYGNEYDNTEYSPSGFGVISAKSISLYHVNYNNGISPLGKNMVFGLKVIFASTDISGVSFTGRKSVTAYNSSGYSYDEYVDVNYSKINESLNNVEFGFIFGYGVNRIIKDRVVLSFGFDFTLLPFAFLDYVKSKSGEYNFSSVVDTDQYLEDNYDSEKEIYESYTAKRLFSHEFFNVRIGIGFLAF